ncbi:MAG TPA: hypothetical protein VFF67_03400 [Thermoplasmata archaeon]|nr:hypothetical protein [Thermoplasmata archaeon]
MRKLPLILGIVAIAIGAIFIGYSFESSPTAIPPSGSSLVVTPNVIGSGTMTLAWSGANSGTEIGIYSCGTTTCAFTGGTSSPTGCHGLPCTATGAGPAAYASGASGSIQTSVQGGNDYEIVQAVPASSSVAASVSLVGVTIAIVIGIVLIAVGAFLLVLARRAPKMRPVDMAEPIPNVAPPGEMIYSAPAPAPATVTSAPPHMPESFAEVPGEGSSARRYFVQPTVPSEDEGGPPARPPELQPAASQVRQRPALICPKCGTANDPWLTNCRRCQRSLRTTGTS